MKGETVLFSPGQVLFKEGDQSSGIFFVKEGKIEIYRERDGTVVSLGHSSPGEVIGTVTLFSREPRTASARAVSAVTVMHLGVESLDTSLKEVPVWIQAVLKDAISRLKFVDEKLVEAKLHEKKLMHRVGTPFQHGSQLAGLLSSLVRTGTVNDNDVEMFPLKGFLPRAEIVLLKRAEYLEEIFKCFSQAGLIKVGEDKKYGSVIQKPKAQILEDFGVFCLQSGRNDFAKFAPVKLYPWMSALVRVQKKVPDREAFSKADLADLLSKEMGRTVSEALVLELVNYDVCRAAGTSGNVTFAAQQVQRRVVFENTCRLLREVKEIV